MMGQSALNDDMKDFLSEVQSMSTHNNKDNLMNMDIQLERILSKKYYNPYDVLLLKSEAPEEEIKRAYRGLSVLIHPDKCKDPRAPDAFHIVDQAYKTLLDGEKRKIYQRVMREARERVEFERIKENKRRKKQGLPDLPPETFENEYKDMCERLFIEIEERKEHYTKLEESQKQRMRDELEEKKMKEQIRHMTDEEWEKTRDERVQNWRDFSSKKSVIGTKTHKTIKAPQVKVEDRPASAPKGQEQNKPMGINEDYKKTWK
jgi:DnaJ family protein C protein 8